MTSDPANLAPFLTAEGRHLAMINWLTEPRRLEPFVPAGLELDLWEGRSFVSVVGFRFLDTRLRGLPIPFHREFEEVNLRIYVRRRVGREWRRGVVFVREIAPRRAVAWIARLCYGENYLTLPMRHEIESGDDGEGDADGRARGVATSARYAWRVGGEELSIRVRGGSSAVVPLEGSEEQFIAEHYWGYSSQRDGSTMEYRVDHPPWRVRPGGAAECAEGVPGFYGEPFAEVLRGEPSSAFIAEGSKISVARGSCLRP